MPLPTAFRRACTPKCEFLPEGIKRIGALTTLHDIASSSTVQEKFPALSQAAREVGAYAHQAMGTLGGNLCQGNRKIYF